MMDLEETEDEKRDSIITSTSQHWSEPNANSGNIVNCMLERGLNVGRKILVFGFVATSVPLVVPGFVVASAIGLVVSVPCCFFLVSHRCTQNLMSKLLPKPRVFPQGQGQGPLLFEDVCFKQDIDKEDEAKRDNEMVDVSEENVILDNDCEQGVVTEEFEPELSHYSGDANNVFQHNGSEKDIIDYFSEDEEKEETSPYDHDDVNMEGHLSVECNVERPMSRGTIMEGLDETEEVKAPFEFGDATVVLEEFGDEVKEGDIEEEEMQKETKGLLEKIRDEGRNDMRGEYATGISSGTSESDQDISQVVENMGVGQEEKQDLETDGETRNQEDSKVYKEIVQSRNDDNVDSVCNEMESCEPASGILELEDDGLNDSKKPEDETSELLDGTGFQDEPNGDFMIETQVPHVSVAEDSSEVEELEPAISDLVNQETELREYNKRLNSSDADANAREIELPLCDENRIDPGVALCDENRIDPEVELPLCDENRIDPEVELPLCDENRIDPEVELPLCDENRIHPEVELPLCDENRIDPEVEQLPLCDENRIDPEVEQLPVCDENRIDPEVELPLCDENRIDPEVELPLCDENRIDSEAYSYTIDLHEEPSNVTVDMHTVSMEVRVSSEELESRSSECSSEKDIVCTSDEVLFNEENIWKQIHVVRKIIGYEDRIQASCADELKALYIFTGVEPPTFVKENPFDLAKIEEKLRILMSIVGI